jgi:hypothetical protein
VDSKELHPSSPAGEAATGMHNDIIATTRVKPGVVSRRDYHKYWTIRDLRLRRVTANSFTSTAFRVTDVQSSRYKSA